MQGSGSFCTCGWRCTVGLIHLPWFQGRRATLAIISTHRADHCALPAQAGNMGLPQDKLLWQMLALLHVLKEDTVVSQDKLLWQMLVQIDALEVSMEIW